MSNRALQVRDQGSRPSAAGADRGLGALRASGLPLFSLLLLLLVGCGSEPLSPESTFEPDVSGRWVGTSDGITLDVTLAEAVDGTVSGSGMLTTRDLSIPIRIVDGFHAFPNLRLQLHAPGFESLNAKGWVLGTSQISTRLISSTYEFYTSPADGDSSTNCVLLLTPAED